MLYEVITHQRRYVLVLGDEAVECNDRFGAHGRVDADEDVHDLALAAPVGERRVLQPGVV